MATLGAFVVALSACTAVAADRLPGSSPDTRVEVLDPAASPTDDSADRRTSAAPRPDPASDGIAGRTVPPATTPARDTGTIVAHATAPTVMARTSPSVDAEPVAEFANPTERGGPLVFQAVGTPRAGWIEVLLPVRPNGTVGWVELDDVELTRNPYRIEVDLASYEIVVERDGEVQLSAPVAIGQGDTPTPIGDFYLIELLQPPDPDGPYGTYAYGLSGYSDVLDNFNGGDGVIGIHGTNDPDLLGGPASHGCIRVHNDTIEAMAEFLPLGTPVTIIGVP